jgi:cytidylate kinase
MKKEYDFTGAVRGKFYRAGGELKLPIYLDADLQGRLQRLAEKKGRAVSEVVDQLLRRDLELIEDLA